MKIKIIGLITILCFSISSLYSQEPISKGIYKINQNNYKVEEIYELKSFFISNLADTTINEENPDFLFVDRKLNNSEKLKSKIQEILVKRKGEIKFNNEKIIIYCNFLLNGKIHSLGYEVNYGSKISLQDFAFIDQYLRKNFIGNISSSHDLHLELKIIPFIVELELEEKSYSY